MGETQLYSQRLHGINEKRRILSEVDRIQRELELQKLKLQQLKRKSLRDRWLMDGLTSAPGIETENPLSQTEDTIHSLELELENLQSQLVHLENPELNIVKANKIQATTQHNHLANGDGNQQAVDHKESHEENIAISDVEPPHNSQEEKPTIELVEPSQKESTQALAGQPIPAPRGIKIQGQPHEEPSKPNELGQNQNHLSQNNEHHDPKGEHEHQEGQTKEDDLQNINHSRGHEDEKADQDLQHQNVESHNHLEHETQNLEDLAQGNENVDINVRTEGDKTHIILPNTAEEEDKTSQPQNDNVTLLGKEWNLEMFDNQTENESTIQNETITQPALPIVGQNQDHESALTNSDQKNGQDTHENVLLESSIHDQNQDHNEESLKDQDKDSMQPADDPEQDQLSPSHDQTPDLLIIPNDQGLMLPKEGQVKVTIMSSKDRDLNVSPPDEDQKQSSQVIVIPTPGLDQQSAIPQPGSSASHQTGTVVANTPAECQPLLHKTQDTDASWQPQGTNTAEARDRETPGKKKTCQCCVVM